MCSADAACSLRRRSVRPAGAETRQFVSRNRVESKVKQKTVRTLVGKGTVFRRALVLTVDVCFSPEVVRFSSANHRSDIETGI